MVSNHLAEFNSSPELPPEQLFCFVDVGANSKQAAKADSYRNSNDLAQNDFQRPDPVILVVVAGKSNCRTSQRDGAGFDFPPFLMKLYDSVML